MIKSTGCCALITIVKYSKVKKFPKEHWEQVKLLEKIVAIPPPLLFCLLEYKKEKPGGEDSNRVAEAVEVSQASVKNKKLRPWSVIKSLI